MTSKATIYTALNVPAVTAYPSPTCLQWSDDGQLYLTTKNAVYIMTPQHGITFDTSSAIKSVPQKEDRDDHQSVNWFRTTVVTSISNIDYSWPQFSTAWGATSFGEIDVNITTTAVSPTDLTPRGGCILAILSS
ncbi:hypothetical protein DL96DRAFT_1145418 [Flagelloscypha sp. PMI_526]|nr:hypothetical protein DL96DRAFT_1145418 [Flagelloscypha sp. PMI_526]